MLEWNQRDSPCLRPSPSPRPATLILRWACWHFPPQGDSIGKMNTCMTWNTSRWIALGVMALSLSSNSWGQQERSPGAVKTVSYEQPMESLYEPREFVGANTKTLKYRLLKPFNYSFGKKYPLVLFLHGAGERGDDNARTLIHGAKELALEERRKEFPAYILIPQCPKDQRWSDVDWSLESSSLPTKPSESMELVKELIDEMVENAGIDPERIYITGLSMGGYGTWDAIARYPNFFAAAVPICGGGDPATVDRFKQLPIWCFHGAQDTVVKPIRSRQMIDALKKVDSDVRYTEFEDLGHICWNRAYENPDLYRWLFAQRKPNNQQAE